MFSTNYHHFLMINNKGQKKKRNQSQTERGYETNEKIENSIPLLGCPCETCRRYCTSTSIMEFDNKWINLSLICNSKYKVVFVL